VREDKKNEPENQTPPQSPEKTPSCSPSSVSGTAPAFLAAGSIRYAAWAHRNAHSRSLVPYTAYCCEILPPGPAPGKAAAVKRLRIFFRSSAVGSSGFPSTLNGFPSVMSASSSFCWCCCGCCWEEGEGEGGWVWVLRWRRDVVFGVVLWEEEEEEE